MAKSTDHVDWLQIELEYRANVLSAADLARKYKIKDSTLRQRAKRNGWVREPKSDRAKEVQKRTAEQEPAENKDNKKLTVKKAEQVSEAVSIGRASEGVTVESLVEEAVDQDVKDMNLGLANARKALQKSGSLMDDITVESMLEDGLAQEEVIFAGARELKMLTEITKTSVEVIRKIRGLDEVEDTTNDLSSYTEEQLKAELERLS